MLTHPKGTKGTSVSAKARIQITRAGQDEPVNDPNEELLPTA